jgi:hypothetical protein
MSILDDDKRCRHSYIPDEEHVRRDYVPSYSPGYVEYLAQRAKEEAKGEAVPDRKRSRRSRVRPG